MRPSPLHLILTEASQADADRSGLELVAHVVAASLSMDDRPFAQRLRDPFPWVVLLSAEEQDSFATEVVGVARACAALSRFERGCRPGHQPADHGIAKLHAVAC